MCSWLLNTAWSSGHAMNTLLAVYILCADKWTVISHARIPILCTYAQTFIQSIRRDWHSCVSYYSCSLCKIEGESSGLVQWITFWDTTQMSSLHLPFQALSSPVLSGYPHTCHFTGLCLIQVLNTLTHSRVVKNHCSLYENGCTTFPALQLTLVWSAH